VNALREISGILAPHLAFLGEIYLNADPNKIHRGSLFLPPAHSLGGATTLRRCALKLPDVQGLYLRASSDLRTDPSSSRPPERQLDRESNHGAF